MTDRPNHVPEITRSLTDVRALCGSLGMLARRSSWAPQANGLKVCCPVHDDRSPSCSVQVRKGKIVWKCHACDAAGGVLSLVAAARGLDVRRDFRAVLREAATIAGLWHIVDDLDGRTPREPTPIPIAATTLAQDEPERGYPSPWTLEAFWRSLGNVTDEPGVSGLLRSRGLDPDLVDGRELARAILFDSSSPTWAVCRGGTWSQQGYRLIVPVYDADGEMRSVRAWRVGEGDGPKRLPPYGHKASGLVMADGFALAMLRGKRSPERVVIVEGEPDFLTWGCRTSDASTAVIGITSGSWTAQMAQRVPVGATVILRTDPDPAGERYANDIAKTLRGRAFLRRAA